MAYHFYPPDVMDLILEECRLQGRNKSIDSIIARGIGSAFLFSLSTNSDAWYALYDEGLAAFYELYPTKFNFEMPLDKFIDYYEHRLNRDILTGMWEFAQLKEI